MSLFLSVLSVLLAWTGFILKFQLLFFFSTRTIIVRLKQNAYYFIVLAWVLVLLNYLFTFTNDTIPAIVLVALATGSTIFGRYVVVYDTVHPHLASLDRVNTKIETVINEEPEVAVLTFDVSISQQITHCYPLALLRLADIVYRSKDEKKNVPDYSLTFCLLCNTIHAYQLPIINDATIEISSNNGTVLNGNKILADPSGKYIWQQFSGKSLNQDINDLHEYPVKRLIWEHIKQLYPNAYVYYAPRGFLSKLFFSVLAKLVKNREGFSFSRARVDSRLRPKELIHGIKYGDAAKAYPLTIFDPDPSSPTIMEDTIDNQRFTIVEQNRIINAFTETGLQLKDGVLQKNDKHWTIHGKSLSNEEDLEQILVTERAYWYSWSKFNPNTSIYNGSLP